MEDAPPANAGDAPLDPLQASPRELMQALLPAARRQYIKAWELLADAGTPPDRRRAVRERVKQVAADHAVVSEFLRSGESSYRGEDLQNARHLASELERHTEALGRLSTISALGLIDSAALRPEALGCGKRYRTPPRPSAQAGSASRIARSAPTSKPRDPRERRRDDRPFSDRGPKVPREALGTSKHDATLADALDEETRAKLEAMRRELGS